MTARTKFSKPLSDASIMLQWEEAHNNKKAKKEERNILNLLLLLYLFCSVIRKKRKCVVAREALSWLHVRSVLFRKLTETTTVEK